MKKQGYSNYSGKHGSICETPGKEAEEIKELLRSTGNLFGGNCIAAAGGKVQKGQKQPSYEESQGRGQLRLGSRNVTASCPGSAPEFSLSFTMFNSL